MLPENHLLKGKKGLIVGIANEHSIAAGCATAFRASGAELCITYQNDKARKFVDPVATSVGADMFLPLDVTDHEQTDAVFSRIEQSWGKLDFLLHSIAFCPREDLHGRVVDCSQEGFGLAMDISVHSLIRLARRAEPLMHDGGTILTVSYHGAETVVGNYNVMGPVKAASEIDHFDTLINDARARAPMHRLTTIDEVGAMAACLVTDFARSVTGNTSYIDGGHHVV